MPSWTSYKSALTVNLFFWKEWFEKRIRTIKDWKCPIIPSVFQSKYSLQKTTFLHLYQVIAAVPGHLLTKGKTGKFSAEMMNNVDPEPFHLDDVVINLLRAKSKDFYWLIVDKKYKEKQIGARDGIKPFL